MTPTRYDQALRLLREWCSTNVGYTDLHRRTDRFLSDEPEAQRWEARRAELQGMLDDLQARQRHLRELMEGW